MRRGFVASTPRATGGLWKFREERHQIFFALLSPRWDKPWRLTWHLKKKAPEKRRFLLETIIFRFRVKLLGCMCSSLEGYHTKGRFLNTSGLFFCFCQCFTLKYDSITILLLLSCSSICKCRRPTWKKICASQNWTSSPNIGWQVKKKNMFETTGLVDRTVLVLWNHHLGICFCSYFDVTSRDLIPKIWRPKLLHDLNQVNVPLIHWDHTNKTMDQWTKIMMEVAGVSLA